MRVERIELNGFKSFSEKTVFNLHPGITAIVGPNGCGKSNIVDAFKWVLGEQSAKSLRGDRMEDVIFAGSAAKKTKGMAEVTLVLSDIVGNPSNDMESDDNKDTTEISVTRRLYRSGESAYMMNKVPCRLKDIKNMFLDTGLELKAYSILEQGRIGDIINSKPQERRFLIEEIAGVMKYKVRKNEALNKLEASKSNLQRLRDIITEVKRQISAIDRHAKKAEKYKKLFEEVKEIEIRIAKRDSILLQNEINDFESSEDALKSREAEISANVHSMDALIEEKKRLCIEQEKLLGEVRTKLYSLEKEIAEDEGQIALLKSDCENQGKRHNMLARQDSELNTEKENTAALRIEIENSGSEMMHEISLLENILEEKKAVFSDSEKEIFELEHDLENERKYIFSKAEEISSIKNEMGRVSLNIENIKRKTEKGSSDIGYLNESLYSLNTALEETKNEQVKCETELEEIKKIKETFIYKLKGKKLDFSVNEKALYGEREELAGMGSRLESLKEQEGSHKQSPDEKIKIMCQVADIFESPPEYEAALEAVLGEKLNAAIVEDQGEITKALQFIKEQQTKRSGFITVDTDSNLYLNEANQGITAHQGVIGEAVKFITVKEGFEKVAASLLNDVFFVDSIPAAMSLWGTLPAGEINTKSLSLVTLEGEVLEPSGMVFCGSEKGVLMIKRLIKELEKDISSKKEKIIEAEKSVMAIKEEIASVEDKIISADEKIYSDERHCHELKVKLENLEEENMRLLKKHEYISLEINDDHKEGDSLINILGEKKLNCETLESEKRQIEEKIKALQETIFKKREFLEEGRSELTEVKISLTSDKEKTASFRREIERLDASLSGIERKKEEILNERISIKEGIGRKEQEIEDKEDALKSRVVLAGESQAEASKMSEILESKTAELALMEKQEKAFASELESIRRDLSHVGMSKMEKSMKLNYLKDDIGKTYSLDIETANISDAVEWDEEERLPQLKEKLQAIGPVSLGTLEEFEELKSRYDFLSKQSDDLLQSIEALEDTIRKINNASQKRLMDAFEALNEKFKEVFTILFGRGRAELHLTEGNVLDSGIEIVAQPPGKRLQNLNLLSGGEKALTALSLLFAGFMIKPTPLCLLDEVDAPLDESNTDRFIKLLKQLAKDIQFIAISHNRRTMEAADYIYGITMEEPGASKVVSMHMAEAV